MAHPLANGAVDGPQNVLHRPPKIQNSIRLSCCQAAAARVVEGPGSVNKDLMRMGTALSHAGHGQTGAACFCQAVIAI